MSVWAVVIFSGSQVVILPLLTVLWAHSKFLLTAGACGICGSICSHFDMGQSIYEGASAWSVTQMSSLSCAEAA